MHCIFCINNLAEWLLAFYLLKNPLNNPFLIREHDKYGTEISLDLFDKPETVMFGF